MASSFAERSTYDAIVIGSGQAGTPLAQALATSGHRTALIESAHVGGTCVNEGCTPTKTMVASARAAWVVANSKRMGMNSSSGIEEDGTKVDMGTVRTRKRDIVNSFRGGSERRIKSAKGLDLLEGTASFVGPKEVKVVSKEGHETTLNAEQIFINTGCRPSALKIPGIDKVRVLDSTSVMELDEVPEHLIIIGGGYVGLEFGQMFRRFGSRVTILQRGGRLLGREDADVAEAMLKIMTDDDITVLLNGSPQSINEKPGGGVSLTVKMSQLSEIITVEGSHLLAAAGRTPNTEQLSLALSGIEIDSNGYISTNAQLETNVPGIYALGDVKGGPAFTHISYDDFRIIRNNVIEQRTTTSMMTDRIVPYVMYTDPQYARVGHSETSALSLYHHRSKILVGKMPMEYVARALEIDETKGFMKVIVEEQSGKIIGFMCLGVEGGEIMSMVQIAMMGGMKWWELKDAIFAHPSFAESLNNVWGYLE